MNETKPICMLIFNENDSKYVPEILNHFMHFMNIIRDQSVRKGVSERDL